MYKLFDYSENFNKASNVPLATQQKKNKRLINYNYYLILDRAIEQFPLDCDIQRRLLFLPSEPRIDLQIILLLI